MNIFESKTNDINQLPVELIDDGVNYGIIYIVKAGDKVLQAIENMFNKFYELTGGTQEGTDAVGNRMCIPISLILCNGDYEGSFMGYEYESGDLVLSTICRGNVIVPFRDALFERFPSIDYIEVVN